MDLGSLLRRFTRTVLMHRGGFTMAHLKTAISLAAIAVVSVLSVEAMAAAKTEVLTSTEKLKFDQCIGTLRADRENDPQCLALMSRANIPKADMEKMHDCEGTFKNIDQNADCQSMIKKYPELTRGHGQITPPSDESRPAPVPATQGN